MESREVANQDDKKPDQKAPAKPQKGQQGAQPNKQQKPNEKADKAGKDNFLKELAGKNGLGQLFGNAHHGVGLLPVSAALRLTNEHPTYTQSR